MALMGLVGAAQILALIVIGRPGFELPLVFALIGAAGSFGIRALAKRELMFGPLKYWVCGAMVSMPTGFLLASHFLMPAGAATYLNGPMPYLYFMLLVMSGFLFDVKLTVTCGVIAGLGYLLCAQLARPFLAAFETPDPVSTQDLVDPAIYWIKSFMIVFASVVVGALSLVARNIILSTVKKAYERGNYRLLERVGRGGMGEVWSAEHNMLARRAAVKLIRSDAFGTRHGEQAREMLQRFEREAQATAQLRSPHTIGIYDFGLADDGTFYYVMELLDGLDLHTLVERHGPQPAGRTIAVLRQACASLEEAHRNSLVHRDIKPANIFICRYGVELDFVKVLDFGLVKDFGDNEGSNAGRKVVAGTPSFISPESVDDAPIDARADLYALGCVGYWMLTGQTVFSADSDLDMIAAHVREPPPPPSTRTELEVPEALEDLIMRCLEKHPNARPQSAAELAGALSRIDGSDWSDERRARWWQMHAPNAG